MNKSLKLALIVFGLAAILVVALWMVGALDVFANATCSSSDDYILIENRIASDLSGNPVFIVRGVAATGEGTPGGGKFVIPACGSSDPSILEIRNVNLILDGHQIFLLSGSVGRDLSGNPTEAPQP